VLGPTIRISSTPGNAGRRARSSGTPGRAIEEFGRLLDDQAECSANHPTTYLTRLNLAVGVGRAGSLNGPSRSCDTFWMTGPHAWIGCADIMETRGALAYWLVQSGDFTAASEEYRLCLPISRRSLERTRTSRLLPTSISHHNGRVGYVDAAIDESRLLLADRVSARASAPRHCSYREALNFWMSKQLLS